MGNHTSMPSQPRMRSIIDRSQSSSLSIEALLDNGYVSAASGHGSAFEESLKDDSDRESVASDKENPVGDNLLDMPGSFGYSHGSLLQEPESPLPSLPLPSIPQPNKDQIPQNTEEYSASTPSPTKDGTDFPINSLFPSVVHEELPNGIQGGAQLPRSQRRKSGMAL